MKPLVILFALLLCDGCSSGNSPNIQVAESIMSKHENIISIEFQPDVSLQSETSNKTLFKPKKTQFMDLNEDVLFIIFTNLQAKCLLNVAKSTEKLAKLTAAAFRWRYRDYEIHIINAQENQSMKCGDSIYDKHLYIHDYKLCLSLLEYFADSFKRLEIYNIDMSEHHSNTINRLVNKYAADYVTHLDLQSIKRNTLEQFTVPFKEVQVFNCLSLLHEMRINMQFDKLFPKLQSMKLIMSNKLDYEFINCKLPHLHHLSITFYEEQFKRRPQIDEVLRKNSQIQRIEVKNFPFDYVKTINHLLPNIEQISLHGFDTTNDRIHFENVTHFALSKAIPASIDMISFAQLESIKIKYWALNFEEWKSFFQRHQSIIELHLQENFTRMSVKLVSLTAVLPNLVRLSLECREYVSAEDIATVLQTHDKLMHFQFTTLSFSATDFRQLREQFQDDWHIENMYEEWASLAFTRKNATQLH